MTRSSAAVARVERWLTSPLSPSVERAVERIARAGDVVRVAIMPDVHLAHDICVGTVVATRRRLYPQAVGGDIGCGMLSVRLSENVSASHVELDATRALRILHRLIPSLGHGVSTRPDETGVEILAQPLSDARLQRLARRQALVQLGTLGRGNHFVELQESNDGRVWVTIHSGSRGMGQAITTHHLARAIPDASGHLYLNDDTPLGVAYLKDVEWARAYARANRTAMLEAVEVTCETLWGAGLDAGGRIHCDHNHVRRECHSGKDIFVHRKGALSAGTGEPGIIPGSMATLSFHVEGRGDERSLCSSSHGAGRSLSRTEARRQVTPARLRKSLARVHYDERVEHRLAEESPDAYHNIEAVMRAQRLLTRIVRPLRPLLAFKG